MLVFVKKLQIKQISFFTIENKFVIFKGGDIFMSHPSKIDKVFRDIVHNFIYVENQIILDLINSKEIQRLRRIKQLGTSYLTYSCAEHSRFNHSLGTYEVMRRLLATLESNGYVVFKEEEKMLCLCAALLHDIGHGPFSHAIEKVTEKRHENWTREIIEGDTSVNRILRDIDENFPKYVADIISKMYPNKLIVSLITSQLDVDRIDYLLRDSIISGVPYGLFDLERLLRVLVIHNGEVVVKERGLHNVEQFVLARYYMYWQVYFHPVTRSAEIILRKIFQRAKKLYQEGWLKDCFLPKSVESLLKGDLTLEDYLQLDEVMLLYCFKEWAKCNDIILSDLCDRFLNRRLFKYKKCGNNFVKNPMMWMKLQDAFKEAYKKRNEEFFDFYFAIDTPSDVPYDFYKPSEKEEQFAINVLKNNSLVELSRESKVINALTGTEMVEHRVYFADDKIDLNDSNLKEILDEIER
ncbi:metal dependent phosphohydrolase [Caldicellulosiruptor saccharolyticus DSM 8903]|uniref:Metal dependent phosphohydrolase n=2 Tax=Caldicellulosiruptor saccharolyticus TaxID=44001 RepID=A4XK39_CALS8|nr:metal dependent phosphohydrolase [Caldicellulosiruptor saccharolyticus DSM 8903]